ncbi:MAG: CDP-alcohol phosphatidyltransferase family protein [Candidatus Promineifilaceae bacterium]|nr:CDP-alcohol phosphatidyltransferase family protein [Candidatus Promineifilaceae bacterium]
MNQTNSTETNAPEKKTFTDQMRVRTHFIVDPVVTFMARYKLSPDLLTVVGMLSHFLFAWLIAIGEMRWAGIAMLILSPLDAFDGALSRKLGRKQGGFGAFLDSTLDRLAEVILFGGFIFYYMIQNDPQMLAVAYVAVSGSLMVSYSRAKAESLGYDSKIGIASRVERYFFMIIMLILNLPDIALIVLAILTYITVAQRMYHVWKQEYGQGQEEEG